MITLPDRPYLKIKEVASYFGVCPKTIRRWVKAGELEIRKIGGSSRVTKESVDVRMEVADIFARRRNY
jgi:excisionase family DNA binding protein